MPHILTMSPHLDDWYTNGVPVDPWTVALNYAAREWAIPDQQAVQKQHANLREKLLWIASVQVTNLGFPSENFIRSNDLGISSDELEDQVRNGKYKADSLVFIRDTFISNEEWLVLISNFRKQHRKLQSRIMEILLRNEWLDSVTSNSPESYFEWGDFRYIARDKILFAGYNRSGDSRNSQEWISYVVEKFGLSNENVCIVSARWFHIDTVFSVITDNDGKIIWGLACKWLIENYQKLEAFLKAKNCFLIEIDDKYWVPTAAGNEWANGAINTLQINEYLIWWWRFDDWVHEQLTRHWVRFIESAVDEFWKAGWWVHCLTAQL